jgi:hypothetical protein
MNQQRVAESAGRKELPPQRRVPPAPTRSPEQQTARDSASDQRHDELATPLEPPRSTRQIKSRTETNRAQRPTETITSHPDPRAHSENIKGEENSCTAHGRRNEQRETG